ncbi:peptide ABC transporter [Frankia sp. CcI49]|uniref:ABC transporter permease n=1 Tax=unclassified Frankia TaxID=2632575 RepID=UPI0006CA58E1|nr:MULTISPECIES: ABC transporter permease [unclassified Frankia]KPM53958.1 peptide ABC transporter [Frankia sp. R43]ONH61909.1 peptide ABC transporter [Frankia sp. CcI49]
MLLTAARRIGRALLVVLLVTMGAVALLSLAPGSAASVILGENATPEAIDALNAELGLDRPLWSQYVHWIGDAVTGDLGTSPITHQPVLDAITERLPVTLELAALGLLVALLVAVPLAVASAAWPGSLLDRAITALSSVFLSVPAFIAGPVLVYVFALQAGWFPVTGWTRISEDPGENLRGVILPVIAIALTEIASFHRLLRTDLVGTLREDFIGAARAKGMSPGYVMARHALRPSSFSLVTLVGINLGRLIGGTVIVESFFSLPGLGQLVIYSITARDIITVQGVVVFIAVVYVAINMLVDLSYGWLDPRVRKAATA